MKTILVLVVFISIQVISAAPDKSRTPCSASWLNHQCLNVCSQPGVCSAWVQTRCQQCEFVGDGQRSSLSSLDNYVPSSAFTNSQNFCEAAWLKSKCLSDCKDSPESCTSWLRAQCKNCKYFSVDDSPVIKDAVKNNIKDSDKDGVENTIETPVNHIFKDAIKNTIKDSDKDGVDGAINSPIEVIVKDAFKDINKAPVNFIVKDSTKARAKSTTNAPSKSTTKAPFTYPPKAPLFVN